MALSAQHIARARQLAQDAPELTAAQRERLRAILAGCQPAPVVTGKREDTDDAADAAA